MLRVEETPTWFICMKCKWKYENDWLFYFLLKLLDHDANVITYYIFFGMVVNENIWLQHVVELMIW